MGFLCGPKVVLDAQMNRRVSRREPHKASARQVLRLRLLGHTEDVTVEGTSLVFPSARHGKLHMVECSDHFRRQNFFACFAKILLISSDVGLFEDELKYLVRV
jgi:hypothetical protein